MFASDLDAASRAQLAKGARLVELLKQPQSSPYPVEEQVVSIWAGTSGQLDSVAVEDVRRFEAEFLDYLRREKKGLLDAIRETKKFDDDTRAGLEDAVKAFKEQFQTSGAQTTPVGHEADPEALGHEVEQEKIVKQKH
jgi:F-type H+-transporting ATPase subunit alpha